MLDKENEQLKEVNVAPNKAMNDAIEMCKAAIKLEVCIAAETR